MVATSAAIDARPRRRRWAGSGSELAGLVAIIAAFGLAYHPALIYLNEMWSGASGTLSHGYLVAAISAYIFVRSVPGFLEQHTSIEWRLLPALLALSVVWLLGYAGTTVALQAAVLPAMLLVALGVAFGLSAAHAFSFPILYFYFAMPAWDLLQPLFQSLTVFAVGLLLRVADIPALIEGSSVYLPVGAFEIAGSCAGLNFIVAGLSLAALYGHLFFASLRKMFALAAITFTVAVVGNWLRVFAIIAIGHQTEMQSSLVADHKTFGWVLFACLVAPVFYFARKFDDRDPKARDSAASEVRPSARSPAVLVAGVSLAIVSMSAGPIWARLTDESAVAANDVELTLPRGAAGWLGPLETDRGWQPDYVGAHAERLAEYRRGDRFVLTYTNLYLRQEQGRELINYRNRLSGSWLGLDEAASERAAADGFSGAVAAGAIGKWLIWYRYQISDRFVAGDSGAKLSQALATLAGERRSGIVAFATPCNASCEAAAETLSAFTAAVGRDIRIDFKREERKP